MKDKLKNVPKSDIVDVKVRDYKRTTDRPAQTAEVRKMPKGNK